MIKSAFNMHIKIMILLLPYTIALSAGLEEFGYKTPYNEVISYCTSRCNGPAFVRVGDHVVFSTQKNEVGDFERLMSAGSPYSHQPVQFEQRKGQKDVCLRWVIEVGFPRKHYIIDFTSIKPFVAGPFLVPGDSDEVKAVYWGKRHALIKFKSLREFKYFYKEKTIIEN